MAGCVKKLSPMHEKNYFIHIDGRVGKDRGKGMSLHCECVIKTLEELYEDQSHYLYHCSPIHGQNVCKRLGSRNQPD
jgi:hypothetical protein